MGRHFEREEAGQQGDNVDSQQVLSSAPLLLPLRTFGRLGWGRCSEGSLTYYIINQGEKNFANGEKKISDKKGLTFCDPPPPGHLMWFTSMGGSDISTHLKIGADNSLIRLKLDTCLVTLVAATSLLKYNSIQGHLILVADSTKSRQLK